MAEGSEGLLGSADGGDSSTVGNWRGQQLAAHLSELPNQLGLRAFSIKWWTQLGPMLIEYLLLTDIV